MKASTLGTWGRALRRALRAAGCDADALIWEAGLDPAAFDDPQARYPLSASRRLWALAVEATGDEGFGLTAARQAEFTHFHALGVAVVASLSLRDALERCSRYLAVVSDAASLELRETAEALVVTIAPAAGEALPSPEAIDAYAAIFTRLGRGLLGRNFNPLALTLQRPQPRNREPWERMFRCDLRFGAPHNELWFPLQGVDQRLDSASPELAEANERIAQRLLDAREQSDWGRRVQRLLMERLPQGDPGEAAIAEALHLSQRSLQRKLAEQGTRYGALLQQTREALAQHYLREGRHSISEIAYLLGFGDASSFTRAFKRWTGRAPSQCR